MNILHIDSSAAGDKSFSRRFSAELVSKLKASNPDATIIYRDLVMDPFPHIDGDVLRAMSVPADQLNDKEKGLLARSDKAVDEVLAAEAIVIGAPMYNFTIPSALKAWIDHIVRSGRTFTYGASGPEGLIPAGRKVYVVASRGGKYENTPAKVVEHQDTYLKHILGFIGLKDVAVIHAEGTAMGPESAGQAEEMARSEIAALG